MFSLILTFTLLSLLVTINCDPVPPSMQDCRSDKKGADYQGKLAVTASGHRCLEWEQKQVILRNTGSVPDYIKDLPNNYCRNPMGLAEEPWCYVADALPGQKAIDFCNVPYCPTTTMKTTTTTTTKPEPIPDYINTLCSKDISSYRHADVVDKAVYYICTFPGTEYQRVERKRCPEHTRFAESLGICTHESTGKERKFPHMCIRGNETFPHPDNCTHYLQCEVMNSSPIERPCPKGTLVTTHGDCEHPDHPDIEPSCKPEGAAPPKPPTPPAKPPGAKRIAIDLLR